MWERKKWETRRRRGGNPGTELLIQQVVDGGHGVAMVKVQDLPQHGLHATIKKLSLAMKHVEKTLVTKKTFFLEVFVSDSPCPSVEIVSVRFRFLSEEKTRIITSLFVTSYTF